MAGKVFIGISPPLKAVDNGDGTYSIAIAPRISPGGLTDDVFSGVSPSLKAVNYGDGTYLIKLEML